MTRTAQDGTSGGLVEHTPLAVICGGGSLPRAVVEAVTRRGRAVAIFALKGFADPALVEGHPHLWGTVTQYGRFRRFARAQGCREVVLIGSVLRPSLSQLSFDLATVSLIPRFVAALRGGDDHLLSALARVMEEDGFRLLASHDVAPDILMPAGLLGRVQPSEDDTADIRRGLGLLAAMGPYDVGQAVVVARGYVLAVEAAEGTDLMLQRVADLRGHRRVPTRAGQGVLVKAPKPHQDRRIDLPTIGPDTVEGVARAGLAGLAVAAGSSLVAEMEALVESADRLGIFVTGWGPDQNGPDP